MKQFKLYKHIKKIISYCIIAFLLIGTVGCQKTNRFETSDEVDFYVLGSDGIIGYQFNDEKLNEITKTDIKIINTKTTGLGLAIAQRLVTRMGGQISASLQNGIFAIQIVFPIVNF